MCIDVLIIERLDINEETWVKDPFVSMVLFVCVLSQFCLDLAAESSLTFIHSFVQFLY